jgi:hypothetical protein
MLAILQIPLAHDFEQAKGQALKRFFTIGSEELMEREVQQVESFFVRRLNRSGNSYLSMLEKPSPEFDVGFL